MKIAAATKPASDRPLPRVSRADRTCSCGTLGRVIVHLHPLSGTRDIVCECPACGDSWSVGE